MNEEAKNNAKSLAERLDLNLREVVQRAVPEYFKLDRDPKTVFRSIQDTERLNLCYDYVFLDEREQWLHDELIRLKRKYLELKKAIEQELADCEQEKERLLLAIRYSTIRECQQREEKASAPTNLISPSKELLQK